MAEIKKSKSLHQTIQSLREAEPCVKKDESALRLVLQSYARWLGLPRTLLLIQAISDENLTPDLEQTKIVQPLYLRRYEEENLSKNLTAEEFRELAIEILTNSYITLLHGLVFAELKRYVIEVLVKPRKGE